MTILILCELGQTLATTENNLMIGQYELERIERTTNQNRDRLHELDSLRSDVGRLEDSLQEARYVTEG